MILTHVLNMQFLLTIVLDFRRDSNSRYDLFDKKLWFQTHFGQPHRRELLYNEYPHLHIHQFRVGHFDDYHQNQN